ncbi:competence protein CoiA family protein [[Kitasatospora] papulosa]|uniref:competence protein CoiA family protein n=1 Tax=[Kitasatospora] papulosa TaxID=1464011 RepID=UPI0036C9D9D1
MGFTAQHDGRGRLDATQPDLGCGWEWAAIHRSRPRVVMTCPECAHPLHAKVSPHGLRFFAHDPGSPICALAGESMEHHLLKLELATAVRAAGHHAELEVRGPDGDWRADVMASSPDGTARMAWEAQLSAITAEEIKERTARFAKDGVRVCWVATRLRPWVGAVPSVHARPPTEDEARWTVASGLVRFEVESCNDRWECPAGHGHWREADTDLRSFVQWVLTGRAVPFRLPNLYSGGYSFHGGGHVWAGAWTAPQYIEAAADFARRLHRAQVLREESKARWLERKRRAEQEERQAPPRFSALPRPRPVAAPQPARSTPRPEPVWVVDLPGRERDRLNAAVVKAARELHHVVAQLRHTDGARRWARGTPLYVLNRPYAVLRPRPGFVNWSQLKGLVIFVRNHDELRLLGQTAPNGTRIIVLPEDGDTV